MTQEERQDLVEKLVNLSKEVSYLNEELRNLEKADFLQVSDERGYNGNLCVYFKDNKAELVKLVWKHLKRQECEALTKIYQIMAQLSDKEIAQ